MAPTVRQGGGARAAPVDGAHPSGSVVPVVVTLDEREEGLRVDQVHTKRGVWRAFFSQSSPRVLTSLVLATFAVRMIVGAGSWGWADLLVLLVTALAVGPVEWILHKHLLHAEPDSWPSRKLGTGGGHRRHHLDPPAIEWLLLRGTDARQYAVAIGMTTAAWSFVAVSLFGLLVGGQAVLAPMITAVLAAFAALWHYELTHLLVHTNYRPKTRYYRTRARHHRRHHFRNENYWLGITSSLGDRIFHTLP